MSKIFKRITAVFLAFLIMFGAVPNITEWAPMNDVSMIVEANFSSSTGNLLVPGKYYFEGLISFAFENDISLSHDVKTITFSEGSRIV